MIATACAASAAMGQASAQYRLTFTATWTAANFPQYPPNPHFSGLIGGTHDTGVTFWEVGQLASLGIKNMAELGSKNALTGEVLTAIAAGTARDVISGPGLGAPPASASMTFNVYSTHPLATVVTMIAPSPDWFLGVSGLSLGTYGDWEESVVVDLDPYDAGTDSGVTYTSPNQATVPPVPIHPLGGISPFIGTPPLGTFTFELLSSSCWADCDADGNLNLFDFLCYTNEFNAQTPYADCNHSGNIDLFDFLCYVNAFNNGC